MSIIDELKAMGFKDDEIFIVDGLDNGYSVNVTQTMILQFKYKNKFISECLLCLHSKYSSSCEYIDIINISQLKKLIEALKGE